MKRLATLLISAVLILAVRCAHTPAAVAVAPETTPTATAAFSTVTLTDQPTTVTVDVPSAPPAVTELSDDPLVKLLSSPDLKQDAATSLQINAKRGDGDPIMAQCTTWLQRPETVQRASALLNLKATFQIVPIKPTGPLSLLAEARRVDYDVTSGALAERIAVKRKELADLRTDFVLACGAMLTDVRTAPLRFAAALAAARALKPLP